MPEKPQTVDVIEMDELFAYTKKKKQSLRNNTGEEKTAPNRGFDVTYDKSENRIPCLVDSTIKAKHYYSDANPSYQKVSYSGQHFYFRDKSPAFTVESVNSDIRKYIATLQRKSKCFFRSLETFKAVMHVFVYAYNKFGEFKRRFPCLKSAMGLTSFLPCL